MINITDLQGQQMLRDQAAELLYEIIKMLGNKQKEYQDDLEYALDDPNNLRLMLPHLDKKIPGMSKGFNALSELLEHYLIVSQKKVPEGLVGDPEPIRIKYKIMLLRLMANFKKDDFQIFHDIALQVKKAANRNTRSDTEKGNGGFPSA